MNCCQDLTFEEDKGCAAFFRLSSLSFLVAANEILHA
jgi:hypothetical protein